MLYNSWFDFCTQSSLFMSRFCEITGSIPAVGHNVSKSNIKTKRMFVPNLKDVSFKSEILSKNITMRVNVRGMRTVMKHGGLDNFLLTTKVNNLTLSCQKLRRQLKKKTSTKVAVA
jgi:large subunit ribosomal protein L28